MSVEKIQELCYKIIEKNKNGYFQRIEQFIFKSYDEYTQIICFNNEHSVMFKIYVKNKDLGIDFTQQSCLERKDALSRKWEIKECTEFDINNYGDWSEIFTADYKSVSVKALNAVPSFKDVGITQGDYKNIYYSKNIRSCIFDNNLHNINACLLGDNKPLVFKYKYDKIFNFYCLVASKITTKVDYKLVLH